MESTMFLEINDLKKSFGQGDSRVQVLRGIDLSVDKGEICVLLGPSWLRQIDSVKYHWRN